MLIDLLVTGQRGEQDLKKKEREREGEKGKAEILEQRADEQTRENGRKRRRENFASNPVDEVSINSREVRHRCQFHGGNRGPRSRASNREKRRQ